MLFNTLAYARFFVLVFVAIWLLVDRRNSLLLPGLAAAGFVTFAAPSWLGIAIVVAFFGISWLLLRRSSGDSGPSLSAAATVVLMGGATLQFLSLRHFHSDPLSLALSAINVPRPSTSWGRTALLVAVLVSFTALMRTKRLRMLFIVAASYVFYAHWDWHYLPLIWGSSSIDWWLGRKIGNTEEPRARRAWLMATVAVNFGSSGFIQVLEFWD